MARISKEQVKKELCAMVDEAMDRKNIEVCLCACLIVCIDCGVVVRLVVAPWSSRLWIQPLIHHREARLVYLDCCVVIYLCAL